VRKRFSRLADGLAKTRQAILDGIRNALSRGPALDESGLADIEETLIGADVGVDTSAHLVDVLRSGSRERPLDDASGVTSLLADEIRQILENTRGDTPAEPPGPPLVVMVVGVNGVGKTTSIGKLARRYVDEGRTVILAAADTFRAAAVEQLAIWAERSGAQLVGGIDGGDPAAVAYDALDAAVARGVDVLIVDTAGRLHTQKNLVEELRKIRRVLGKRLQGAPHEVLLVVDANTGQNAISQAKLFDEAVGLTGIVLAKLDGTARGGIVIPIARELSIPVRYVGTGESIDDLEDFDPRVFAGGLLGVGGGPGGVRDRGSGAQGGA